MPAHPDATSPFDLQMLLGEVVSLIDWPAAIVADGSEVLAYNALWAQTARTPPNGDDEAGLKHGTLAESLKEFTQIDALVGALEGGSGSLGVATAVRVSKADDAKEPVTHEFTVRWRHLQLRQDKRALALVILQDTSTITRMASVISSQHARINQLLIRQTLIEESERRRIGQELHDGAAQVLAQVRQAISPGGCIGDAITDTVGKIDKVIENIRTLSFELSPPILEDLGLRPALQWLAEHLNKRYDANITVLDDECEPPLSSTARTILFRAVRELSINAAKHAPGAEIVVSCISDERVVRIIVKDTGPGFDTDRLHTSPLGVHNYGLLSVEQQIRGIGGSFEINSEIGDGTRVTIVVPLEPRKGAGDDQRHHNSPR